MDKNELTRIVMELFDINVLIRRNITFPAPKILENLNKSQYMILAILVDRGKCTMGQMAEKIGVSCSQLTGLIDGLVATGFVLRQNDESNRRVVLIDITQEGRAMVVKNRKENVENILPQFEVLSEKDYESLRECTKEIKNILNKLKNVEK